MELTGEVDRVFSTDDFNVWVGHFSQEKNKRLLVLQKKQFQNVSIVEY